MPVNANQIHSLEPFCEDGGGYMKFLLDYIKQAEKEVTSLLIRPFSGLT